MVPVEDVMDVNVTSEVEVGRREPAGYLVKSLTHDKLKLAVPEKTKVCDFFSHANEIATVNTVWVKFGTFLSSPCGTVRQTTWDGVETSACGFHLRSSSNGSQTSTSAFAQ